TGMTSPKAMDFGPGGDVYVVGNGALGNSIQRFDRSTGAALGSFIAPGAVNVTLVPVTEEFRGLTVTGLVPEGWDSAGFGQWTAPGLGDTAIVQQARLAEGSSIDSMANGIADFFDIPSWSTTRYEADRTWDVFEGTDGQLAYLMGLTEDSGMLLLVLLATPPDLLNDYQNAVFTPALDAIHAA
ncbi:MAG: hypothetical protein R3246_17515, partial [Acidimicrobiia bacterium]|nr:hypothetical protein [Acidimicrobiia bacterium]